MFDSEINLRKDDMKLLYRHVIPARRPLSSLLPMLTISPELVTLLLLLLLFAFGRQQSYLPKALKALFDTPTTPMHPTLLKMPSMTHLMTNKHES
jgi:hypothetical protein